MGGDVITAVDQQTVSGFQELRSILSQMKPGQEVNLSILRDGKTIKVPVTLGE